MVSVDVGTREGGGQVVVALRGELDLVDAASVAAALTAAAAREREIIVDLAGLDFIDCSGVTALVRARKQARHAGGDLLLAAPQRQVLRLLTLTRLIDVFSVHASVDEATGCADRSRRMAALVAGRPVRPARGDVQAGCGGRGPQPGGPAVRGRRARCHTLRHRACRLGRTYLAPASQFAADLGTPTNPHPLIVPGGQAGASRPDRDKRAASCHGDKAASRGHRAGICRCSSASTSSALASGPAWPAGSRASSTSASKRPSSHARASSARRANRRSQPRPVSNGTPIRRQRLRRGGQANLSERMGGAAAVHPDRPPAKLTATQIMEPGNPATLLTGVSSACGSCAATSSTPTHRRPPACIARPRSAAHRWRPRRSGPVP